jgi:hypothetical protein
MNSSISNSQRFINKESNLPNLLMSRRYCNFDFLKKGLVLVLRLWLVLGFCVYVFDAFFYDGFDFGVFFGMGGFF